ncbi:hypothetical protein GCM10028803_58030 [Larkinella knui]|uniref:Uncharacterized protein n=1 Tax=Larkinella knui TaxID=2025310 RepID=A0A3P1CHN0_9BACT|nr:hypothetical protein [Larkinella knui]RRB12760.1 hypothetical protein EHT87_21525 [Larkinella knui]
MLAYLFAVITTVFLIGLTLFTTSKPSLVGENAMGYGLGLFFLAAGFALASLIFTIALNVRGGFDWVAQGSTRTLLVLVAWLLVALTTFFSAVFKWEWHSDTLYPAFLYEVATRQGHFWIPLLWLIPCFLSLHSAGLSLVPLPVLKGSFWVATGLSAIFSAGLLVGYVRESARSAEAEMAQRAEQEDRLHRENLETIAAQKVDDPIVTLLGYSGRYQPDDVRQAALAKIKAHPNWEAELIALLQSEWRYKEVYYFLDGNAVEHPEQFVTPLNQSIGQLSARIRADIQDSNNLQHWSFDMYGIDQLLRALDQQFLNQGVDFYPSIVKLQQALNTPKPERFKDVRFSITATVDQWLVRHKK